MARLADERQRTRRAARMTMGRGLQGGFPAGLAARPAEPDHALGRRLRRLGARAGRGRTKHRWAQSDGPLSHTAASGSELQVESYYDHSDRASEGGGRQFEQKRKQGDHLQPHVPGQLTWAKRHRWVCGGGMRTIRFYTGSPSDSPDFFFIARRRAPNLADFNIPIAVPITLARTVRLTVGLKVEDTLESPAAANRAGLGRPHALTLWGRSKAVRLADSLDARPWWRSWCPRAAGS